MAPLSPSISLFHEQCICVCIQCIYVCIQLLFKYIFLLRKVVFDYDPSFERFRGQVLTVSFFSTQFIEYSGVGCPYIHAMPNTTDLPALVGPLAILLMKKKKKNLDHYIRAFNKESLQYGSPSCLPLASHPAALFLFIMSNLNSMFLNLSSSN